MPEGETKGKKSKIPTHKEPEMMEQEEAGHSASLGSSANDNPCGVTVEVLISEFLDMKGSQLDIPISDIVFQGFRPKEFLAITQRQADTTKLNRQSHKKNLLLLGMICVLRGSKINKIIQSSGSTRKLKDVLSHLRGVYTITDGRPSSPTTATVPRFLAVTAVPVSLIIHEDNGEQTTLPISPMEVAADYPFVFCMSHASALLPANVTPSDVVTRAVAYGQYLMTLKFGGKATKTQVLQFVLVAAKSNLWTNEQKLAYLNKLKIYQAQVISPKYKVSLEEAAYKFEALP